MSSRVKIWVVCALGSFVFPALAANTNDEIYRFRSLLPLVIDAKQNAVYADVIESTIKEHIEERPQFQVSPEDTSAKNLLQEQRLLTVARIVQEKGAPLLPIVKSVNFEKTDALVVAEVERGTAFTFISLVLINVRTAEVVDTVSVKIENTRLLSEIKKATSKAFGELCSAIPFDTDVVSRDGYKVVLNLGAPFIEEHAEIPTYTIQNEGSHLSLRETGKILITQVGEKISFGEILMENKPYEIHKNNKIVLPKSSRRQSRLFLPPRTEFRGLAATTDSRLEPERGLLGALALDLGGGIANFNNVAANGSGSKNADMLSPGGALKVHLRLSETLFADGQFGFAITNARSNSNELLNSNINSIGLQLGYRFPFSNRPGIPQLRTSLGFARNQFAIDNSTDPLSFVTTTYSGATLGGGVNVPITQSISASFDVLGLFLGSVVENAYQSGATVTGVSGWKLLLGGHYRLTHMLDLSLGISYEAFRAEFTGSGTRPVDLSVTSHSIRSVSVGATYFF